MYVDFVWLELHTYQTSTWSSNVGRSRTSAHVAVPSCCLRGCMYSVCMCWSWLPALVPCRREPPPVSSHPRRLDTTLETGDWRRGNKPNPNLNPR